MLIFQLRVCMGRERLVVLVMDMVMVDAWWCSASHNTQQQHVSISTVSYTIDQDMQLVHDAAELQRVQLYAVCMQYRATFNICMFEHRAIDSI